MATTLSIRLNHRPAFVAALVAFSLVFMLVLTQSAQSMEMRDDGIHTEKWMKQLSFLELKGDMAEAQAKGKGLAIIFEQPGCGSCKRLHEVNFQDQKVVDFITANFDVLQINMYGDNLVTDFDGEELSEVKFTEKLLINFSPTTVFFGADGQEIFRIPGYLQPSFYLSGFEYVVDEGPQKGILFPRWLKQKRDRMRAQEEAAQQGS